ncbi:hypothetical protein QZH41_017217, partial [Actinostola sp. cb2023]
VKSENSKNNNPFTLPSDNDIFMLRDKERQRKKEERVQQRNLKVHEKTTYTSRVNAKTAAMRKIGQTGDDEIVEEEKKDKDGAIAVKDDPQFTLAITRDRHVEKENLADFIAKKREMFLVQYSLGVKRDEMRKLEEIAQAEEKKLELAEQYLEEDAAMFDEFLKENDKNSVEAIKIAEAETKLKLEKVADIKKINAQMMLIKSFSSTFRQNIKQSKQKGKQIKHFSGNMQVRGAGASPPHGVRRNHETEILKGQIDFLKDAIKKEEERAAELEMKSKMFSYGEFKAEDQEKMLAALNNKVEEVYRNCIGDNEANISTLQMLTNIENRLEELFEQIEIMPPDRVEMAEKAKEKERRLRVREEKMEQQRLHQEDRVRRALERAQAEPKKKTGKPLMFRSEPPQTRKKQQDADKKQDKEEEELKYFFT